MELGLSLGDSSRPFVGFMEKPRSETSSNQLGLGFTTTTLSIGPIITTKGQRDQQQEQQPQQQEHEDKEEAKSKDNNNNNHPHLHQLDFLPQLSLPWHPSENGRVSKGLDVNVLPLTTVAATAAAGADDEVEEGEALSSSPNSAASSFQTDLCIFGGGGGSGGGGSYSGGSGGNYYNYGGKRDHSDGEGYDHQRDSSRASDEDENCGRGGGTRKKLRLSKEQSAYLEESFKEHNTLNPKQKLALAKQLNLRPRQVEVWFQNRRARTKLKQTEVDCEYLKRCCETLTEENRKLHKELQELRALKTSNPFYMQLPATTLTMCPSCERVATNPSSNNSASPTPPSNNNSNNNNIINSNNDSNSKVIGFPLGKHTFHPFAHTTQQQQHHPHQSTAS